jgi:hypothetical protein
MCFFRVVQYSVSRRVMVASLEVEKNENIIVRKIVRIPALPWTIKRSKIVPRLDKKLMVFVASGKSEDGAVRE